MIIGCYLNFFSLVQGEVTEALKFVDQSSCCGSRAHGRSNPCEGGVLMVIHWMTKG